jgi:hypothetical protein
VKRRLRKKKRVGEFQELGFEVAYRVPDDWSDERREEFLWQFLERAIEAHDLEAGGGGGNPRELLRCVCAGPAFSRERATRGCEGVVVEPICGHAGRGRTASGRLVWVGRVEGGGAGDRVGRKAV